MKQSYKNFDDYVKSLGDYGDKLALTIKPFLHQERTTFHELQLQARQVAHYLSGQNLKSGDRIMIIAGNSPSWVKLFLGAQLLGVIVVPVDASSSLATVEGYIRQTEPQLIFRGKYILPALDHIGRTVVIDELAGLISHEPSNAVKTKLAADTTAVIVFTSGTTAEPKGVVLSQTNILSNIVGVRKALDIDPNWRLLSILPLSHMYELTAGCLTVLSGGATIYYLPQVAPLAIARALNDYGITALLAVPQLAVLFLQKIEQTAADTGQTKKLHSALRLSAGLPFFMRRWLFRSVHKNLGGHLQFITTGGAPMPVEVARTWERMGVKILQGYGLTETGPVLTLNTFGQRRLDSQGRVIAGSRIRPGKEDEIEAKGPSVFTHYWHNEAATRAAFTSDGWFKTGDIGDISGGWLRIKGRSRFKIVLASGLKVFPEDVEAVANKQPALGEVCVIAHKQADGETVRAVVLSDYSDVEIDRAIETANTQLESFQHISDWVRWPDNEFPRTRLLKVDRRAVEARFAHVASAQKAAHQNTKPADPVVVIIRLALNDPRADIPDDARLSSLGLDSLRRLSVVSLIEERMSVSVPEASIGTTTTVKQLRQLIEHSQPAEPPARPSNWQYRPGVRVLGMLLRETLGRAFIRYWVRVRVEGREHLKNFKQPALFIFNHVDGLDAPIAYSVLPFNIRNHMAIATAADVMTEHKLLGIFSPLLYAGFPLSRKEPYLPSLEYAASLVDKGWNVALAPEGRMSNDGKLQPFKSGIGLLAVETGVPVVPVKSIGLYGTIPVHHNWPLKHSKAVYRIGQLISFPPGTSYDDATQVLMRAMEDL